MVVERARAHLDAVAVGDERGTWSYGELQMAAAKLGGVLRAAGAGPGRLVGVCVERSRLMSAAILGVLQTGAAYLPLDPGLPGERLGYMVEDSGAVLVLAEAATRASLPRLSLPVIMADEVMAQSGRGRVCGSGGGTGSGGVCALHLGLDGSAEGSGGSAPGGGELSGIDAGASGNQ